MEAFRWIAISLAMILGLGVTRVLSSAIAAFRSRTHAKLDWIPLVWAAAIFVLQIQFWWAAMELPSLVHGWTLVEFLTLLGVPLALFVAAGMVLPPYELEPGASLRVLFERDGRWALLSLVVYSLLAIVIDVQLFHSPLWTPTSALLAAQVVLPLCYLAGSSRGLKAAMTLAYFVLVLGSSWLLSPKMY
jgi:hypothetical protein